MNQQDRKRINELRVERSFIVEETLKLRARQINLDRERAELARVIADRDATQNGIDQQIAEIIRIDYQARLA